MDKTLRNVLILGILLISGSFAFYFLYFLPNKEAQKENKIVECSKIARDEARGQIGERYDGFFERCLKERGIK